MAFENYVILSWWFIKSVSKSVSKSIFESVSKSISRLLCRVFATERSDLVLRCTVLASFVEESDNVHSRSHAYGRDKIDLTGLTVKDAVFGEVLEEALC
jgi:hypothetical protein